MKDRLVELIDETFNKQYERMRLVSPLHTADYLLENGVIVLPLGTLDALYSAVDALADMVNQFGYSTTFRKQDAVCDGGLSALENAFGALFDCGYRLNSNGTINRKNLWNYRVEDEVKRLLKGGAE